MLLALDARDPRPLHRQVYDGLRESILAARLRPGERLPSTRTLAADLGVARNTVALAFDQLRTEGYLTGRRGGGTRVRSTIPDTLLHVGFPPPPTPARTRGAASIPIETPAAASLSARGDLLAAAGARATRRGGTTPVPFRLGVPALDAFPAKLWARLTARRWRRDGVFLGDADCAGEPVLREAIASYLTNSRGARCTPDQVCVVSGTQQAVDLVARVLLDPGDEAWVEEPGYHGVRAPLLAAGARLVPVPVDDEGIDVAAGERAAPNARLAYVTPSHQFPLGAIMSASRRAALLAWARRAGAWVLEDDYDSEFRYTGRPLPCLQGLDAEHRPAGEGARVLYIGTFGKTLVPALRLGYVILPESLVDRFLAARAALDRHPPTMEQAVVADFLTEGHYARHVRRVRAMYAERQGALLHAARSELAGVLDLRPDPAGLHLVGWLPPGLDDLVAADAAAARGVEVFPLSRCLLTPAPHAARGALLLSCAAYDPRAIRAGVRELRLALASVAPA